MRTVFSIHLGVVEPHQKWSAVLCPVDHTWIGFLKDTPEKETLTVSSEACLEFENARGLGCRSRVRKGYTVLETALEINPNAPRREYLIPSSRRKDKGAAEDHRGSVRRLVKGDSISMGLDGYLKVEEPLPQAQPLMSWKPCSAWEFKETRNILNDRVLKRPRSLSHWELMDEPSFSTKPIPIHIISENLIDHSRQIKSEPAKGYGVDSVFSNISNRPNKRAWHPAT